MRTVERFLKALKLAVLDQIANSVLSTARAAIQTVKVATRDSVT